MTRRLEGITIMSVKQFGTAPYGTMFSSLKEILAPIVDKQSAHRWICPPGGILPVGSVPDVAEALDSCFMDDIDIVRTVPHPARFRRAIRGS